MNDVWNDIPECLRRDFLCATCGHQESLHDEHDSCDFQASDEYLYMPDGTFRKDEQKHDAMSKADEFLAQEGPTNVYYWATQHRNRIARALRYAEIIDAVGIDTFAAETTKEIKDAGITSVPAETAGAIAAAVFTSLRNTVDA